MNEKVMPEKGERVKAILKHFNVKFFEKNLHLQNIIFVSLKKN